MSTSPDTRTRGARRVVPVHEVNAQIKGRVLGVFDRAFWFNPLLRAALIIAATILFGIAVTTPLEVWQQALFSIIMFAAALV
ncbi:MAG: hypothetical protein EOO27_36340, partial [Comamonadaceae bacterium]